MLTLLSSGQQPNPMKTGVPTLKRPSDRSRVKVHHCKASLEPMCLPGQVGVPDNSNTLDDSQPREQERHREEDGSGESKGGETGRVWWKRGRYIWEHPYSDLLPPARYGGTCGSDQKTTSSVLSQTPAQEPQSVMPSAAILPCVALLFSPWGGSF